MSNKNVGLVAVVFDGDDTLWSTEPLYDRARQQARAEVERAGLDGDEWEYLERAIDVENVHYLGFSLERFPTSCVQAYEKLARAKRILVSREVTDRVRTAAQTVFSQDAPLLPGARETLQTLRARGVRLALLTKGDQALQVRRVERSGVAELFDLIHIVPEKPPDAFSEIVAKLKVEPHNAWSVGNSIRSDILPAIKSGLRGVWIDAHVWEHEQFDGEFSHRLVLTVPSISDVADAIDGALVEESEHGRD